jgi:hypothetical protein
LLLVPLGLRALTGDDPASAVETFGRVAEIGERFGDPDVLAFGRLGGGQTLIALGQVPRGVSLLDEAMVGVTADDVSPMAKAVAAAREETPVAHRALDRGSRRRSSGRDLLMGSRLRSACVSVRRSAACRSR